MLLQYCRNQLTRFHSGRVPDSNPLGVFADRSCYLVCESGQIIGGYRPDPMEV